MGASMTPVSVWRIPEAEDGWLMVLSSLGPEWFWRTRLLIYKTFRNNRQKYYLLRTLLQLSERPRPVPGCQSLKYPVHESGMCPGYVHSSELQRQEVLSCCDTSYSHRVTVSLSVTQNGQRFPAVAQAGKEGGPCA